MIPCAMPTSWTVVKGIILRNTTTRLVDWEMPQVIGHMIQFTLEILGGTLPWSPLLIGFASPTLRRSLGTARPQALFLTLCLIVAFPTCWLPPAGSTRYFTPLYPCLAVLVGIVLECAMRVEMHRLAQMSWRWYIQFLSGTMLGTAVVVVGAALLLGGHPTYGPWAERLPAALAYGAAFVVLAAANY